MILWNDQIKVPLIASFQKRKILYNLVYNLEYTLSTFDIEEITFFILISGKPRNSIAKSKSTIYMLMIKKILN